MSMEHRKTILAILDEFMEPALRPINAIAENLAAKNAAILQQTSRGGGPYNTAVFMFQNKAFPLHNPRKVLLGKSPQLAQVLIPEFESAYRDFRCIVDTMNDLYQLLVQTTLGSTNRQEFRDAVPDCIAMVTSLRHTPRHIQDPLYLCRGNTTAVNAYHRLLPKAEEYAAYHLIL